MQNVNLRFAYDGTFEGFLCMAIRCINMRSMPSEVTMDYMVVGTSRESDYQLIRTDRDIAGRFYNYIGKCSCPEVQQMALDCFLTGLPNKERDIISLIVKGIRFGATVAEDYSSETMRRIQTAIRDLYREAQSTMGTMSFDRIGDVDVSLVNPQNSIIPLVRKSVLNRTELDDFIVYDKRHLMTFIRCGDLNAVLDVSRIPIPNPNMNHEAVYEYMWKYLINTGEFSNPMLRRVKADELTPMWYIAS